MLRSHGRTDPLNIAVLLVIVLSLLPTPLLGRVNDVAEILNVVRTPFGDLARRVSGWLRPPDDPLAMMSEDYQKLAKEREIANSALFAAWEKIKQLEQEIEELQQARRFNETGAFRPLVARIIGMAGSRADGPLKLNVGKAHGVAPGVVAVHGGADLVGRVGEESDVSALNSVLILTTDPIHKLIQGMVTTATTAERQYEPIPIQLIPIGDGTFVGDISDEVPARVGDVVRLWDVGWPETAQGMIIGQVESMTRKDDSPKRMEVVVRPRIAEFSRLLTVTLKLPETGAQP